MTNKLAVPVGMLYIIVAGVGESMTYSADHLAGLFAGMLFVVPLPLMFLSGRSREPSPLLDETETPPFVQAQAPPSAPPAAAPRTQRQRPYERPLIEGEDSEMRPLWEGPTRQPPRRDGNPEETITVEVSGTAEVPVTAIKNFQAKSIKINEQTVQTASEPPQEAAPPFPET